MSTNDRNQSQHGADDGDDMQDALRWQLRGLRRDAMPQRDLWPGIAARLQAEGRPQTSPRATQRPRVQRHYAWLALAASLALAIGIGWQLQPTAPMTQPGTQPITQAASPSSTTTATLVAREATALTWEYKAALREVEASRPSTIDAPALRDIDRGVALVRHALGQDPQSAFLLERLHDLYAQRLAITRRLALA